LRELVDAEVVADLVEGLDEARFGDGVADARARHAVGFREGAGADDARVRHVDPGQRVGGREIGVGFVEAQHRVAGQGVDQPLNVGGSPP
jgi:hypothetical protein